MKEYIIVNAHQLNQCHPETCGCPGDYLVCEEVKEGSSITYDRVHYVRSEKHGEEVIKLLKKYPEIFQNNDFETGLIELVKNLERESSKK